MATAHVRTRPRQGARGAAREPGPKTTRPDASSRREKPAGRGIEQQLQRTFDAFPDRIDAQDWAYQPSLRPLPDQLINCHLVPEILDQGQDGACTGFALAAVINYLLARRGTKRIVSPRMLYELVRRYDEWPGENYAGSSARGAMKAWERHGVCTRNEWPDIRWAGCRRFHPAGDRTPRQGERRPRGRHRRLYGAGLRGAELLGRRLGPWRLRTLAV